MPGVELSRLNRNEMKRLLAAAESRRDHALAGRLRTELDAGGAATAWGLHAANAKDWDSKDWDTKIWDAEDRDVREKAGVSARIGGMILVVSAASLAAMAVGWQLGRSNAPVAPLSATVAPAQVAQPAPTVALPPQPPPRLARLAAVEVAPAPPAAAKPAAKLARAEPRAERSAAPERSTRDRQLLQAYDRARAAGVDPLTLDADQARFRAAVEGTRDPIRANALYAGRIKELEAAAQPPR